MSLINKYNEFILERKLELLFESRIHISDDLSNMLGSKDMFNNVISRIITSASAHIDTDTKVNFIDVSDTNDRLSFINDDKGMDIYNDDGDVYKSTSRNEVKVGKIIRKLLSSLEKSDISKSSKDVIKSLTDKDIEDFVNLYKSTHDIQKGKMDRFELVEGDDVKKYYLEMNYLSEGGILGSSCMRYNSCQEYIEFYTKNNVKLLILFADDNEKMIIGRAIIWEDIEISGIGNGTFMDRIYTTNDSDTSLFKKYAKDNKWWYKSTQDSSEGTDLYGPVDDYESDEYYDLKFDVKKLSKHYSNKYPYMDTLKFYYYRDGYISNNEDSSSNLIELVSVDGRYECDCDGRGERDCYDCDGRGEIECRDCDGYGKNDCGECNDGSLTCGECDGESYITCPECDGDSDDCDHCGGEKVVSCEKCSDGEVRCDDCDGEGRIECSECESNGEVRCEECSSNGSIECCDCEDYQSCI